MVVGAADSDDEEWHGEDGNMREWERKKEREEKKWGKRERERQHRSMASPPVTTDSCGIVEMGEWHGYGERTGKEIGRRKEEKK